MIKAIRHIGIQVKDMQESLAFWKGQGFIEFYNEIEEWPKGKLHIVKLCLGDGPALELVEILGNLDWPNHIAVTVDKLPFPKFATKRPGGCKVAFAVSPEGMRLELVEEP